MKRTLIIISMLITGAAAMAVEGPGTYIPSATQLPSQPAEWGPAHLDSATRILQGSPQPEYNTLYTYGNYQPINPNFGSRIYSPYGGYANIYRPGFY